MRLLRSLGARASIVYSKLTELLSEYSANDEVISMSAMTYISCPETSNTGNPPLAPRVSELWLSFILPDGPKRAEVMRAMSWAAFRTILEIGSLQKLVVECEQASEVDLGEC